MKKIGFFLLIGISFQMSTYAQTITKNYKNNVSIKPFNLNNMGVGIGALYERYLDSTNNFSIIIPLDYSFGNANTNKTYYSDNQYSYSINTNPGVRFYFVEPRNFNWYLGCSFPFGTIKQTFYHYDPVGRPISELANRWIFGTLVNVGFKGTIKSRFTYNLEIGNGIKFLDQVNSNSAIYYSEQDNKYMGSILVGFGYNF